MRAAAMCAGLTAAGLTAAAAAGDLTTATRPPNFVLVFIDDTGWGDYSFNDPRRTDTPHLAALARRGMTLTDFHAGASVCTPSRAALMTGRLGIRSGVSRNFGPFSSFGLPLNETTVAEMLKGGGKSWPLHHKQYRQDVIKLLKHTEESARVTASRARTPRARLCRLLPPPYRRVRSAPHRFTGVLRTAAEPRWIR